VRALLLLTRTAPLPLFAHPDVTMQNPATLLHHSPQPVDVELTIEPWEEFKNGGWVRLLQQLWSAPALSFLNGAGAPDDSVEVWCQLADVSSDDLSRAKPREDHFDRIDTRAPKPRWKVVSGLGGVDYESVLIVRLPRVDLMLPVAPAVVPLGGE
jgi:hypothetical protein